MDLCMIDIFGNERLLGLEQWAQDHRHRGERYMAG